MRANQGNSQKNSRRELARREGNPSPRSEREEDETIMTQTATIPVGDAMPAEVSTKANRDTWSDWFPDARPRWTIDGFIKILERMGVDCDATTLRYWQTKGVIPHPVKRWTGTSTQALYPTIAAGFIHELRELQQRGFTLDEIAARLRGLAATMREPDPIGLTPAIVEAAQRQAQLTGVPVSRVEVTFIDDAERRATYLFDTPTE